MASITGNPFDDPDFAQAVGAEEQEPVSFERASMIFADESEDELEEPGVPWYMPSVQ